MRGNEGTREHWWSKIFDADVKAFFVIMVDRLSYGGLLIVPELFTLHRCRPGFVWVAMHLQYL